MRRLFRPAVPAQVRTLGGRPAWVASDAVSGLVRHAAGPVRIEAEWWEPAGVARDSFDVEIEREGLFRIFRELADGSWYVDAEYD